MQCVVIENCDRKVDCREVSLEEIFLDDFKGCWLLSIANQVGFKFFADSFLVEALRKILKAEYMQLVAVVHG